MICKSSGPGTQSLHSLRTSSPAVPPGSATHGGGKCGPPQAGPAAPWAAAACLCTYHSTHELHGCDARHALVMQVRCCTACHGKLTSGAARRSGRCGRRRERRRRRPHPRAAARGTPLGRRAPATAAARGWCPRRSSCSDTWRGPAARCGGRPLARAVLGPDDAAVQGAADQQTFDAHRWLALSVLVRGMQAQAARHRRSRRSPERPHQAAPGSILAGRGKAASWGCREGCALRVMSAASSPRERRSAARRAHSPAERGALAQPDGRPAHKADARAWSNGHAASSLDARRGCAGVGRAQAASGAGAAPARTRQGRRPPPSRRALTGRPRRAPRRTRLRRTLQRRTTRPAATRRPPRRTGARLCIRARRPRAPSGGRPRPGGGPPGRAAPRRCTGPRCRCAAEPAVAWWLPGVRVRCARGGW